MRCGDMQHSAWIPETELDRRAVLTQLERVLKSGAFKSSKRCLTLLRHVVESVLEGNADCLKERMLGVSVFGRKATYDTSQDPIVRMTAVEIRRRLALYYQQSEDDEILIALPIGSYVPEFSLAKSEANEWKQRVPLKGSIAGGNPIFIVVVVSAEDARSVDIGQIGQACRSWFFEDKNRCEPHFLDKNLLVAQMSGAEGSLKLERS